ncbi:hypothetical protein [Pendulispora albinea]|uniref:Uncharacterized protein n=1 Tax=Pendulispora albinea TaxID=2741071 RepID=A0ABZ2MCZ7_9BACT
MRTWLVGSLVCFAGIAVAGGVFIACDNAGSCDFHRCDPPFDGGHAGVPGCETLDKDPKDNPACIHDEIGVFVSPFGVNTNLGTQASPVASIAVALEKVGTVKKRIYICDGTYSGPVTISARSVSLYGGFQCAGGSWKIADGASVIIESPDATPALLVDHTANPITIADLTFKSKAATAPGGSSIAGRVTESKDVAFKRVTFAAEAGAEGVAGEPQGKYDQPAPNGNNGASGGGVSRNTCPAGMAASVGGAGGAVGADGGSGEPKLDEYPPGYTGAGGDVNRAGCGGPALPGAFGAGGAAGGGASIPGVLTGQGWGPQSGERGGNGRTAQGGGGGAGYTQIGGGGGAGGCGGLGGTSGGAGGSSIALLVFQTKVTLDACTLQASDGKSGGKGGAGQVGQLGSALKGVGVGTDSCDGALGESAARGRWWRWRRRFVARTRLQRHQARDRRRRGDGSRYEPARATRRKGAGRTWRGKGEGRQGVGSAEPGGAGRRRPGVERRGQGH